MYSEGDVYSLVSRIPAELRALEIPEPASGVGSAESRSAAGGGLWSPREQLARAFERCERRLREGLDAPLRVAFFGPTGVGKSKLFNSLLGRELSPSGFRRPCTMEAVYLLHESRKEAARDLPAAARLHADDRWRHVLLVDTPDFDSVERQNRLEAERVLAEADALVFVTDVHKYGDQSTWEYLERIVSARKPLIVVLNKVSTEEPAGDFFSRMDRDLPADLKDEQRLVLAHHSIDDHSLIPAGDPGLVRLDAALGRLVSSPQGRTESLVAGVRAELALIRELWAGLKESLQETLDGVTALRGQVESHFQRTSISLQEELRVEVDSDMKAEVFSKVLRGLERIDLFRYPRKLMYLPIKGLKTIYDRLVREGRREASAGAEAGAATDDTYQILESRVLELTEVVQDSFRAEARCPGAARTEALDALRIDRQELLQKYRVKERAFKEWLRTEVEETAGSVTGEHKMKFILAQVLYNGAVLGVQISTGGLGVGEVVTDALVSPLVAKAVGMAVSSERVVQFEKNAREKHHELLSSVLEEIKARAFAQLDHMEAWRDDFAALEASIEEFLGGEKEICDAFEAGTTAVRSGTDIESEENVE